MNKAVDMETKMVIGVDAYVASFNHESIMKAVKVCGMIPFTPEPLLGNPCIKDGDVLRGVVDLQNCERRFNLMTQLPPDSQLKETFSVNNATTVVLKVPQVQTFSIEQINTEANSRIQLWKKSMKIPKMDAQLRNIYEGHILDVNDILNTTNQALTKLLADAKGKFEIRNEYYEIHSQQRKQLQEKIKQTEDMMLQCNVDLAKHKSMLEMEISIIASMIQSLPTPANFEDVTTRSDSFKWLAVLTERASEFQQLEARRGLDGKISNTSPDAPAQFPSGINATPLVRTISNAIAINKSKTPKETATAHNQNEDPNMQAGSLMYHHNSNCATDGTMMNQIVNHGETKKRKHEEKIEHEQQDMNLIQAYQHLLVKLPTNSSSNMKERYFKPWINLLLKHPRNDSEKKKIETISEDKNYHLAEDYLKNDLKFVSVYSSFIEAFTNLIELKENKATLDEHTDYLQALKKLMLLHTSNLKLNDF